MLRDNSPDLDGIVLVRLLVRPKKFTLTALAADLRALLWLQDAAESRRVAEGSLARLKVRGFIWPDTKFILTDEGTAAALQQLGYSQAPRRQPLDWRRAKKLLVVQRFRLTAGALSMAGQSDHLAAWVIAREEGLELRQEPTPSAVLRALAWRALGLPDSGSLAGGAALGALLGLVRSKVPSPADAPPGPERPAAGAHGTRATVSTAPVPSIDLGDPSAFGRKINELALSAKEGRWLGDKVFIAQVWKDFQRQGGDGDLPLARFKQRLTEAARGGHVLLSRADLIEAYPQEDLRQSQIEAEGELYHFVETQHLR